MMLSPKSIGRRAARLLFAVTVLLVAHAHDGRAQTPKTYFACYVPLTGTVYRIKETNLKQACTAGHVEFSWTDGAATGGVTDHGVLTGLNDDDHPQYLLANGVRNNVNGFAVTGSLGVGSLPVSGPGVRMLWYPAKAAFRAGSVVGNDWDEANIGDYSAAFGGNVRARGRTSFAAGNGATADGEAAISLGYLTSATAYGAVALGLESHADGIASTAFGTSVATGAGSVAGGDGSGATGHNSVAFAGGRATGTRSFAVRGTASGNSSVALGGAVANADNSVALGPWAHTNGHRGVFIYGDDSSLFSGVFASADNQFVVRAQHFWFGAHDFVSNPAGQYISTSTGAFLSTGGAWTNASDVALKNTFADVDADEVLSKIGGLRIRSWSYNAEDASVRHVGPTAQDFRAAFGLGNAATSIATVDADGVSLLGIQALEKRITAQAAQLDAFSKVNDHLRAENAELRARLERIEAALKTTTRSPDTSK